MLNVDCRMTLSFVVVRFWLWDVVCQVLIVDYRCRLSLKRSIAGAQLCWLAPGGGGGGKIKRGVAERGGGVGLDKLWGGGGGQWTVPLYLDMTDRFYFSSLFPS